MLKTRGKRHKPRKTQYRSAPNIKHRRIQIGQGRWWFKSRNRANNIPPLGNPPIAQPQVAPSSYVYYDPATIAEQQRLLDMFKHENDIRQMYNVDLQEEKRQLDNFARQKQQRQETRLNSPSQQTEIDKAYEDWLANQPAIQEKKVAQRRFREKEEGKNQYTSHRPSGVGWMGWEANDQANWLEQGTSSDGV